MKNKPIKYIALAGLLYRLWLRNIIKHAIDNPYNEWDEAVLNFLDILFGYKGDQ